MPNYRTGNHGFLRQQNLTGIMHYLYENAPISRVDLSRLTKLNKTTVSSLVEELLKNEFVREIGIEKSGGAGRSSVLLDINPRHGYIVSGEIAADFVQTVVTDFSTRIVWRHREQIDASTRDKALARIFEILREAIVFAEQQGNLLGLALGVHGLVDKKTGTLLFAPHTGWRDVPLREMLGADFQTDIFVDNEANFAALGEQFLGAAEGCGEVLYISIGRGLGGGLVVRERMYNGSSGIAGEFGHLTLIPDGLPCQCGNRGCWETEVSQPALIRRLKKAIEGGAPSALAQKLAGAGKLAVEDIVEAARNDDRVALEALDEVGRQLGVGLASLLNVFNPNLVVLGGELSAAADYLLPAARRELNVRSLRWALEKTEIVVARFGRDAAIMGGVASVFQMVLANLSSRKNSARVTNHFAGADQSE